VVPAVRHEARLIRRRLGNLFLFGSGGDDLDIDGVLLTSFPDTRAGVAAIHVHHADPRHLLLREVDGGRGGIAVLRTRHRHQHGDEESERAGDVLAAIVELTGYRRRARAVKSP
jgi:hypothetical protein